MTERVPWQRVYLIEAPSAEVVKVGIALNPRSRLASLQTTASERLELLYETPPLPEAYQVERVLHKWLRRDRAFGEWFRLSPFVLEMLDIFTVTSESIVERIPMRRLEPYWDEAFDRAFLAGLQG